MKVLATLLVLSIFTAVSLHAQEVYKTVDENGNVIFSDKPASKESEKIDTELKNVQPGTAVRHYKKTKEKAKSVSVQITSPSSGQQFGPTAKHISISAKVSPKLSSNHLVTIFFNGNVVSGPSQRTSTSVPMSIKLRGKNSISAKVTDKFGKTLANSDTISIQVIRP